MKKAIVLFAVLVASVAIVACGSDDDNDTTSETTAAETTNAGGGGGGGGGEALKVTADPTGQLTWEPKELTASAGQVTIELDNPSPVSHDIEISGNGVEEVSDLVANGTATVSADLQPGEYEYYCTVPGHKDAGMDGTLTVK
jgi:plastocyanin